MGVFDKIKNIFFEEEYVEVEEESLPKKDSTLEKISVAKKIDLPEIKREKTMRIEEEKAEESTGEKEIEEIVEEPKFRFPMVFEDDDFKEDVIEEKVYEPPVKEVKIEKTKEEVKYRFENEHVPLYEGRDDKRDKQTFKPTPIISPIYGVLDKNYKKEEIVAKKPIILSTGSSKKMDLDRVRQKAYGDLANDITESMMEDKVNEPEEKSEEDTFYDLNINSPVVSKVTVGDAEEYFNDLGLEYNVDYKDNSMEKATGRRSDKNLENVVTDEEKDDSPLENNLFDLIESMYQDKED